MTSRFTFLATNISGLGVLQRNPLEDSRGLFERMYCEDELRELFNGKSITQINRTITVRTGTVRGLHFQRPPHAETKSVSCLHGEVFDVAVDLRRGSPTFLNYHSEILSGDNHKTMLIPEGFAHGFQTLSDDCELLYLHTAAWHKESEGGLNVNDPQLDIPWPLPVTGLSERDTAHPLLNEDFSGVVL
jgi:dTDP-4-dehydrorhamnose 3,5-epimerase